MSHPKPRSSRLPTLLSILLLLFALGCGGADSGDGSGDGADKVERRFLSVGTAPAGGAFFVVGGALAEVLDRSGPEGWKVSAEATQGSQENIRRLAEGQLDLALSNAAISYHAVRGEGSFEAPYEIRAVMTLAPNVALFVAPAGSGVETIADLEGKRVVVGPAGAGFRMFVGKIVEAHGLTYDDFTPINATQSGAVDQLADGAAAAAFLGGAVPTASITQASTSMDLLFVPFDDEAKATLIETYPFFEPATIPAGTYRNQDEAFEGLNVGSMHLITSADVSEETIYQATKTLYENREAVVERHPAGKAIQPQIVVKDTGTPFHPGAERYYREIGIWPEEAEQDDGGSAQDEGSNAPESGAEG